MFRCKKSTAIVGGKRKQDDTCRSCLVLTDELHSIFNPIKIDGIIYIFSDMLKYFTDLEFIENDGLPKHICYACGDLLTKSYKFKQQCMKSNESLREIKTKLIDTKIKEEPDEETNEEDNEEIYTEYLYDEDTIKELSSIDRDDLHNRELQYLDVNKSYEISMIAENSDHTSSDVLEANNYVEHESNSTLPEPKTSQIEFIVIELAEPHELKQNTYTEENYNEDDDMMQTKLSNVIAKGIKSQRKLKKKPPYKCTVCSKILHKYSSYRYHIQLHTDYSPYLCSICGKDFKTQNAITRHMMSHKEIKQHKCKFCNKSYRQSGSLVTHMLSHTGEKPFLCGICGKGMTQKSGYKKHMLTHTGEKPYKCDLCEKDFRYSSNLILHKRSHTGEKPYFCDLCDKRFTGHQQMKQHKLMHTGEKPYRCDLCGKGFYRNSTMKVHRYIHTGEKKYKCHICDKAYIQLHCLKTHLATHL